MKIRLSFKCPDAVDTALEEEFGNSDPDKVSEDQVDNLVAAKAVCDKFIKYGEYVSIEMDTETGSATVVPVR